MIRQSDKLLAEELVKQGKLTASAADKSLAALQSSNDTLRSYLVRQQIATERDVINALAKVLNLSVADLSRMEIEKSVIEKVPVRFAWYFRFMPIKLEGKTLTIASAAPLDVKSQDEIRVHLGLEPKIVLARGSDIKEALNKYYGLAADTIDRLSKDSASVPTSMEPEQTVEDLEAGADETSVSKLVNQILLEAYKKRATDIHIEPYRKKVRVRYRIDGALVDANIPPAVRQFLPSIISRIKIMANLSIVEKRLPQDGGTVVKTNEQDLDLRISTIPTPRGESMVIRILPTDIHFLNLEKLGLEKNNFEAFRPVTRMMPCGFLMTGPTGSGKSTTLYASLHAINSPDRKIITLEDPIEYEMEGITQIQVNPKVDLTFAAGLRSVLRHDPDVIMVGEIRDRETAEIAIRTALTGHLVFSTLHTNNAASGVTRLLEMGVEPFLVSSSIEAFVAQRLIRVICPKCKEEVKDPPAEIVSEMARTLQIEKSKVKIYHGKGCDHCHQTGFYGRTAIYEILQIGDDLREAILSKKRADHIKHMAMDRGMRTLRQDGWRKVAAGITTPEEVINVTAKDETEEKSEEVPSVSEETEDFFEAPKPRARIVSGEILSAKNEYNSRIYSRLKEKVGIRYSIVRPDANNPVKLVGNQVEHSSITKDISAGGLRFVSGYTLPIGTILDVKVQLEKGRSIDCLAKVCRVEDDTLSAMFNLVVYFLDISSADRARIDKYVKQRLAEQNKPAKEEVNQEG